MTWEEITDLEELEKRGFKATGGIKTLESIKNVVSRRTPCCPKCGSFMHTASPFFGTLALCPNCDVLFYKEEAEEDG